MTTRKELTEAQPLSGRIKILDEFVALTGYHRKPASRRAVTGSDLKSLSEFPRATDLKLGVTALEAAEPEPVGDRSH